MIELTCPICGAWSVDEFRRLDDRLGPDGEVEARWWHALGCRRISRVARLGDELGAALDRPAAPGAAPDDPWSVGLDPAAAPLPRRKGDEPARFAPLPSVEPAADPGPAVPAVPATPAAAAAAASSPTGVPRPADAVPIGIGAPPAGRPTPTLPLAGPVEPAGPDAGSDDRADDVLVALPDAPPVPFERPEWPAGAEAADEVPPAPALPAARIEEADVDDADPTDRFRERRATAQPVERVVRRPVGLVGPNQPRSVDLTRRPPVEHRPAQRQPGVEPRPVAPVPPSLFARTRTWGMPSAIPEPGTAPEPEPPAAAEAAEPSEGARATRPADDPVGPEATGPEAAGPEAAGTAPPAPPTTPATTAEVAAEDEDDEDEAGEVAEPAAQEVSSR